MSHTLYPAYGRDYKSAADVIKAFREGKDFYGDYPLDFQLCSIRDLEPGTTVYLRYKRLTQITETTV